MDFSKSASEDPLHLDLRSVSTLCLHCVYFKFSLNLLLQIQGKLQAVSEKKPSGLSLGLLSVGLGLIGTVLVLVLL